jgi:hypothetical protein
MTHDHIRSRGIACAILLLTLAACDDGDSQATDTASTASTPESTAPTGSSLTLLGGEPEGAPLDAGTYGLVAAGQRVESVAVVSAPAGYQNYGGWTFVTQGRPFRALGYMTADRVFADPCGAGPSTKEDALRDPGPTVKDLAVALTKQKGVTTSRPEPVTLDGHQGLHLDYQVARNLDLTTCEGKVFDVLTAAPGDPSGWFLETAGERASIWILDVDGQRVMLSWVAEPGTTAAQLQELDTMAESTRFERMGS